MSLEQAVVELERRNATLLEEVVRFRDAAMGLNNIYPSVTEGRQNTADGKYFSVAGNGAYMRLYRRQGSSASLIAEFPDRAELNSVIAQLGPLLGRGVVGGNGDLMAVGAGGFMAAGEGITDFTDTPMQNRFRAGVGVNAVNAPNNSGYYPAVDLYRSSGSTSGRGIRMMFHAAGLMTRRFDNNGVDAPDNLFYTSNNVVGRITHDENGALTGAIIERGENANGRYVKYADRTMLQWGFVEHTVDITAGTILAGSWRRSVTEYFNLPHAFAHAFPVVHLTASYRTLGSERRLNVFPVQYRSGSPSENANSFGITWLAPSELPAQNVRCAWSAKGEW